MYVRVSSKNKTRVLDSRQRQLLTDYAERKAIHVRRSTIWESKSKSDKERFVRTAMLRLQQQQMLLRSKLDRAYENRLSTLDDLHKW